MEKLKEYLWIGGIVFLAVALYVFMPVIIGFFARNCRGVRGLIFLGIISAVLVFVFYLLGYRGGSLIKVALLILFIAAMMWLYCNYRDLDIFISGKYGQGAATLVFLAIIFLIWLFSKFLI